MRFTTRLLRGSFAGAVLAVFGLAGCDAGSPPDQAGEPSTTAAPAVDAAPADHPLDALEEGWNSILPGGATVCSDGSEYRFFVRPASREKLLVYFQGGGACWFAENCDRHLTPSYKPIVEQNELDDYAGIFDFANPENPFSDYSVVVAPYCTADVHIGDNVATYQAPATEAGDDKEAHAAHELTIHHRGISNAQAVLDWTYAHFDAPAEIFVTGSSAGSIPSPYYAWRIADHYPEARIAQLGDAAGGYRRSGSFNASRMEQWGTMEHLQQYPEFADMKSEAFTYEHLYIAAAKRHPNILFAQYDAAEDRTQKRFLEMGGADATTLRQLLDANHADILAEVTNFRSYIAGGDSHTILARPGFYTFHVGGRRIRDWVADLAAFKDVEDVACSDCAEAELTGAAAEQQGGR